MSNSTLELQTGLSAVAGGVAGGAMAGMMAGAAGALIGALAGGVAGGLAGRSIAKLIAPPRRTERRRLSDLAEFSTSVAPDPDGK